MGVTREMLEGEAYWGRIRLIKKKLYILEAALITVLAIILVFLYSDFQDNPFYISIERVIWFALIMLLVIELESFVFRIMQIRIAKTFSTKHLMTHNSIRKAFVIIITAAIFLIAFALPGTVQFIEDSTSFRDDFDIAAPVQFLPGDALGLSEISEISFQSEIPVDVYILTQYYYNQYMGNWEDLRKFCINADKRIDTSLTIPLPSISHQYLYMVLDPTTTDHADFVVVSYTLHPELSTTFTIFVPLMCIAFIIANVAWIGYLIPLSRKYAHNSIYK